MQLNDLGSTMKYNKLKNDMVFKNISTTGISKYDIHESNGDVTSTDDYKNHKSKLKKFKKEKKKAIKKIPSTFSTKEFKILKHQTGSDVPSKKKPHNTYFKHHFNEKPIEYYSVPNYHKLNTHLKFTDEVTTTNISNESKYTEVNHLHLKNKKTNKKSKLAKKHTPKIHQCTVCQETFKNFWSLKIHNKQNHSRNQAQIVTSDQKNKNEENNEKHTLLFKKEKKKKNRVCKNKNKDKTSEFKNIDLESNSNAIPQIYTTPQKKVKNIKDNSCDSHHKKYLKNYTVADYTKRRYHNEIFKCDDCEVSFDFLSALQNHKSSAHQEKKVTSPNSITEISSKNDEKEPFLQEKQVKKKKEKLMLDNQIKLPLKENKKLQRTSSSEVLSNNDLENDIAHEHKNKEDNYKIYRCKECRMSFALSSAFFKHNLKAHIPNNGTTIQSNISKCSENNDQKSSLLLKKLPEQMENKSEKVFQKNDSVLMSPNNTNMLELQSMWDVLRNKYLENDFDVNLDEIFIKIFYKCNICSMSFEDSYALKEHKTRVHVIDERVVTGSYTSKNSEDDYDYTQLLKKMEKKQKNENTSTFPNDNHHAKSHAPIEKSTILPEEVVKFKTPTIFEVHSKDILKSYGPTTFSEKSHSNENLNECNICSKTFSDKSKLKKHHYRIHTCEKSFECDVCGKLFKIKTQLTVHYRTHTGEKPFKCDVCSQSFREKATLVKHFRIHTNEKPFECDICGQSFRQKSYMKFHYRTHTGERPFKCDICSASFTQKTPLTIHYRIHTGEKPYECGFCEMAFSSSSGRLKHTRRKHDRCL